MPYGYGDHMDSGWGAAGWIMMLILLVVLVAVVAIIVWTIRTGPIRPAATPPTATAEEILASRLAHGEISPDEYRERLDTLRGGSAPPA